MMKESHVDKCLCEPRDKGLSFNLMRFFTYIESKGMNKENIEYSQNNYLKI